MEYTLLSGEIIDASSLPEEQQKHIGKIEELIESNADYLEVYRRALTPILVGKTLDKDSLRLLHNSSQYKIIMDLLESYHQKCFSK